jgi:hypothetical protein
MIKDKSLYIKIFLASQSLLIIVFIILIIAGVFKAGGNAQPALKQEVALRQVREVARLVTIEHDDFLVYKWNDTKKIDLPILRDIFQSNKSALVVIKAKVLIGFDLKDNDFDLKIDNKKRVVSVTLPEPKVLGIDPVIEIYNPESGWFNPFKAGDDTNEINRQARERILEQALKDDQKERAISSAKGFLKTVFDVQGYEVETKIKK